MAKYILHRDGRFQNVDTGQYMSASPNGRGRYLATSLFIDGKDVTVFIHRALAEKYIPNPDNLPFVNHKDGNKYNNDLSNLEWCTAQENMDHAIAMGLVNTKGENNGKSKLVESQVLEIREKLKNGVKGVDICKEYNIHPNTVSGIKNNKRWKHLK